MGELLYLRLYLNSRAEDTLTAHKALPHSTQLPYAFFMEGLQAVWTVVVVGVVVFFAASLGWEGDPPEREPATAATTSPRTSAAPSPWKLIEGDGTHKMGGLDGKYWGVWQARNPSGSCVWSVRLVRPHTGALVLDEGDGTAARVSVQPVDGGRVVFMTSGCGTWRMVD